MRGAGPSARNKHTSRGFSSSEWRVVTVSFLAQISRQRTSFNKRAVGTIVDASSHVECWPQRLVNCKCEEYILSKFGNHFENFFCNFCLRRTLEPVSLEVTVDHVEHRG